MAEKVIQKSKEKKKLVRKPEEDGIDFFFRKLFRTEPVGTNMRQDGGRNRLGLRQ